MKAAEAQQQGGKDISHPLWFLFFWREVKSYGIVLEMTFMTTIAERLVLREAAAADGNDLSSGEIIGSPCFIYYFEVAFHFQ
jgi:hypothetical protein